MLSESRVCVSWGLNAPKDILGEGEVLYNSIIISEASTWLPPQPCLGEDDRVLSTS